MAFISRYLVGEDCKYDDVCTLENINYLWYFRKVSQKNIFRFSMYSRLFAEGAHEKMLTHTWLD